MLSASFHLPTRTSDRAPTLLKHVIGALGCSYPQWIGPYPGLPKACAVVWCGAVGYPPHFPTQKTSLAPCVGMTESCSKYSALRITQQGLTPIRPPKNPVTQEIQIVVIQYTGRPAPHLVPKPSAARLYESFSRSERKDMSFPSGRTRGYLRINHAHAINVRGA